MINVFIDGAAGTTGLRISERLSDIKDVRLIKLDEQKRKDADARYNAMRGADVVFLCLPDEAAIDAAKLASAACAAVIDASTAHRTADGWVYGMPELPGQREKIRASDKVANPGCHASGFIALVAPLVHDGVIDSASELSCFSLTGYSGGGKKMISEYEADDRPASFYAPRQYGLNQNHKHLPEMKKICGLEKEPVFVPVVEPFFSGMQVTVPVFDADIDKIREIYKKTYNGVITYADVSENGFLPASALSGKDGMCVYVYGNERRAVLTAVYDNLGKGASGAAIQNFNIMTSRAETEGLIL